MTARANKPAYPVFPETEVGHAAAFRGLTIREHFAGLAMQGILANPYYAQQAEGPYCDGDLMKAAMYHADTLIAALEAK